MKSTHGVNVGDILFFGKHRLTNEEYYGVKVEVLRVIDSDRVYCRIPDIYVGNSYDKNISIARLERNSPYENEDLDAMFAEIEVV